MPKLTIETCKAPSWEQYPKLVKIRANVVFDSAIEIKREIKRLEAELKALGPKIAAKLELADIEDEVKSILYDDLLLTRVAAYTRRSLDTKWAVKKLVALKVKKTEIELHIKKTEIEAGVKMQLLGSEDDE